MKKWLVALCMCLCLVSLTACGKEEVEPTYMSEADALSLAQSYFSSVKQIVDYQTTDSQIIEKVYESTAQESKTEAQMIKSASESYEKSLADFGEFVGFGDLLSNTLELNAIEAPTDGTVELQILGSNHNAIFEVVYERGEVKSLTTNVDYSTSEKMGKAGLNTLLGMGTVFTILILISFIIALFGFIPKIQGAFAKKDKKPENEVTKAVDQTIAQIVEKEELSDDTELVAVIAAAIASYESTSTDGFVVRSIRRVR